MAFGSIGVPEHREWFGKSTKGCSAEGILLGHWRLDGHLNADRAGCHAISL